MSDSALPYFYCFAYSVYFHLCFLNFFFTLKLYLLNFIEFFLRPGLKVNYPQEGFAFAYTSHFGSLIKINILMVLDFIE